MKPAPVMIEEIDGKPNTHLREIRQSDLPDLDVLIEVEYSALNYKDGLVLANNKNKVVRTFPMVGGIDLAGTVIESRSPKWQPGDKVILNGFGLSETQWEVSRVINVLAQSGLFAYPRTSAPCKPWQLARQAIPQH